MSKNAMPGSMDLLLDTMCNTFGGVMFIAISLSLAFFVSRTMDSRKENIEKVREELRRQKQEQELLESRRESLSKKLSSMKKTSSRYKQAKSDLAEAVTKFAQDQKDLQRENELVEKDLAELEQKNRKLEKENGKTESEIAKLESGKSGRGNSLREEYRKLSFLADTLRSRLERTPKLKFHFSHKGKTTREPYVIILKNNQLYQLGTQFLVSSREVRVKRYNRTLVLTPLKGTPVTDISSANLLSVLTGYNKSTAFLWIMVHPDSIENFIDFRRLLRGATLPVHWYIDTSLVLYLGGTGYTAGY